MKKVGILYICTGSYQVFWKPFYESFEKNFLNDCELHYFVFTDAAEIYDMESNPRIHLHNLKMLPWPLVTLFRFHTFLSIEEELKEMNYLMFSNANMECIEEVESKDFLPREDMGERLIVTVHPGYGMDKIRYAPLERHKYSYAYVPYQCGKQYVIGAMNGGCTDDFLQMSHILRDAIEEDLKKNVIARWHDESHLNRYIADRSDYRLLSPEYCYPFGMDVDYQPKIAAVSKKAKFDVEKFKGLNISEEVPAWKKMMIRFLSRRRCDVRYFFDLLCHRKVKKYDF